MRLRLIAFLPVAGLISMLLMTGASSLVSALERSMLSEPEASVPIPLNRYETECQALFREIHALSHEATRCDARPACLGSPLLCPAALDGEIDAEFQRLRSALSERCGLSLGLMDYAWGGPVGDAPVCGDAHDWLENATSGKAQPTAFVF